MTINLLLSRRFKLSFVIFGCISIIMSIIILGVSTQVAQAAPQTFTVTNTNASGAGSLAQALSDANSNANSVDQDIIEFDISGSTTHRITLSSALTISEPVLIDGYSSQSGASENTVNFPEPMDTQIRIELLLDDSLLQVQSPDVTIKGVALFNSPNSTANGFISLDEADRFKLFGSHIAVDYNGLNRSYASTSSIGLDILDSEDIQIGGSSPEQRNIFGACRGSCIRIDSGSPSESDNIRIQGNYFGTGIDGITSLTKDIDVLGIQVLDGSSNIFIGGETSGEGNYFATLTKGSIFAQDVSDIYIHGNILMYNDSLSDQSMLATIGLKGVTNSSIGSSSNNSTNFIAGSYLGGAIDINDSGSGSSGSISIEKNKLGYTYGTDNPYPNNGDSISIRGSSDEILVKENVIHNSNNVINTSESFAGIAIYGSAQNVAVLQNSIYNNGSLGIDIKNDSLPLTNDDSDSDSGANSLLNYPTSITKTTQGANTAFTYSLDVPAGDYRIEFFSNTSADILGYGEGETYIGYQNITHGGTGAENFSHLISGTGYEKVSLTATSIDGETFSGFGETSEFSLTSDHTIQTQDIASTVKLLNPEDVAIGAQLNYQLEYINYGSKSIDLGQYINSSPGNDSLFSPILPPDLTYLSSSGNSNVSCASLGSGSAAFTGPILANHSDHELVSCGYYGSKTLSANEKISIVMTVVVTGSSDLDFAFYNNIPPSILDPDYKYITETNASGSDVLDTYLASYPPNNLSIAAYPINDLNITKSIVEPTSLTEGAEITYNITIQNDGTEAIDVSDYDGTGEDPLATNLLINLLPPELDYVGTSDENMTCTSGGSGSATTLGSYSSNHSDHSLVSCIYISSLTLNSGDTLSFSVTAKANRDISTTFSSYGILVGDQNVYNPDYLPNLRALNAVSTDSSVDLIDAYQNISLGINNNFAVATYTINSEGTSSLAQKLLDTLANTGENILTLLFISVMLMALGVRNSQKRKED